MSVHCSTSSRLCAYAPYRPPTLRYAIIDHVVHLVNRDYDAMCRDYYTLEFVDRSVDTSPIAPALAAFFDDVLDSPVSVR